MTGIELSGIVLAVGRPSVRYALTPDPFQADIGQTRIVIAPPPVRRALADVLTGLAAPVAGEVSVRGIAVTRRPPGDRGIALVPADGGLLPHLTVEQNAGYALAGTGTREWRRTQVGRVLAELELTSLRRLRPHWLSAEQRMRVAVARARCLPGGTRAVVIEDSGTAAGRAAVMTAAAGHELAVVVLAGDESRGRELGIREPAGTLSRCRPVPAEVSGPAGSPQEPARPEEDSA